MYATLEQLRAITKGILKVQLRTLPAVIGQGEGSVNIFHDIRVLVKQLKKSIRNLISEVVKMIKLVIAMPATNAAFFQCNASLIYLP